MRIDVYHHASPVPFAAPGGDEHTGLSTLISTITPIGDRVMKTLEELKAALADEKTARGAQEARANAAMALLQKTVDDLKNNPAIPDDVVAGIQAEAAALSADFPATTTSPAAGEQQIPQ